MLKDWIGGGGSRYHDLVWNAVIHASVFRTFRAHRHYRAILEHVNEELGANYLSMITNPVVREICFASEYADTIGSPKVASFEGRKLSPTTLRYGKVLCDLVNYFPRINLHESIIEIGIGYGGQARLISEYAEKVNWPIKTYTMTDLLPVVHLARLYLEHFTLIPTFSYETKSALRTSNRWNLAISNYSFSEFDKRLQEEYLERVLKRSESGYLIMNTGLFNNRGWGGTHCLTAGELIKALPNAVMRREEPLTGDANYVIVYGDHNTRSDFQQ